MRASQKKKLAHQNYDKYNRSYRHELNVPHKPIRTLRSAGMADRVKPKFDSGA